jgi:hypothetical protein
MISHIFSKKEDLKGIYFIMHIICAACALRAARASSRSSSFLALARFGATFDATLWIRLCTVA